MDTEWIIDVVVLAGVALVLPLALGHLSRWTIAAVATALSMLLPTGPWAATAAAGWVLIAVLALLQELRPVLRRPRAATGRVRPDLDEFIRIAATGFALVAATAFLSSRAGLTMFDIGEPIVELTAVHFTYAGVGALVLAGAALRRAAGRQVAAARVAVALTLCAPPVVAVGFVLSHPVPQVGGALLMSAGVLTTAAVQLTQVVRPGGASPGRVLLGISGLAPWVPMVLAVAWAASNYWDVPALSVPDMVRTHGIMQAVFVLTGLLARRLLDTPVDADATLRPLVPAAAS